MAVTGLLNQMGRSLSGFAVLQSLTECRAKVCEALGLKAEDVELSMGMSGDFEQAVSTVATRQG